MIKTGTVTENLEFDFRVATDLFNPQMACSQRSRLFLHLGMPTSSSVTILHWITSNDLNYSTNTIVETGTIALEIPIFSKVKFVSVSGTIEYQFEIKEV